MKPILPQEWEPQRISYDAWQEIHSRVHALIDAALLNAAGVLKGTTASIGGGALLAGAVASGTVSIPGANIGMVANASPSIYPGDGFTWSAQVTSANTVTVRVTAVVAGTPNASTYLVRVVL